jgi:hypothetical protein
MGKTCRRMEANKSLFFFPFRLEQKKEKDIENAGLSCPIENGPCVFIILMEIYGRLSLSFKRREVNHRVLHLLLMYTQKNIS